MSDMIAGCPSLSCKEIAADRLTSQSLHVFEFQQELITSKGCIHIFVSYVQIWGCMMLCKSVTLWCRGSFELSSRR